MPLSAAYHASKMAVRGYGEGLRVALQGEGIDVITICPGFIATGMVEKKQALVRRLGFPFFFSRGEKKN